MVQNNKLQKFIDKANLTHNNKYDYSKSIYVDSFILIEIICPIHNESYYTKPYYHIKGNGICPNCKMDKIQLDFFKKVTKRHGDRYDYSKTNFISGAKPITIICKLHGEFIQIPKTHLGGAGCQKCARIINLEAVKIKLALTFEEFINRAKEIHGEKYDYSKTIYNGFANKCEIYCNIHGSFLQTPREHFAGHGCQKCSNNSSSTLEKEWLDYMEVPIDNRNISIKIDKKRYIVDGLFDNNIYEFLGDFWHGNPLVHNQDNINPKIGKTFGDLFLKTKKRIADFQRNSYNVIYIWEKEWLSENNLQDRKSS